MARKPAASSADLAAFDRPGAAVLDTTLVDEVSASYLEYAYSVIHSRALPDARDGLKPVHRRILYSMSQLGLRPTGPHMKSARVVGDAMGKYHPHGDSAIYDAMVRLAQDFAQNTPLVDGKGNFGSPDDPPAASRYTEARMSPYALRLVDELSEETVDFAPNYDGSLTEPTVLPAAFPNLLVNGSSGIAVGMATNMIPHNLTEVVEAARWLLMHPGADLDRLMEFVPGPDLPTGGLLIGLDQVRQAYETGRGVVRLRGRAAVGALEGSRGRQAITVTELPYGVGAEKIIGDIKKEIATKRLQGVADVKDLTDRTSGTRLVIEAKTGVNPQALLADLYRLTDLEKSFGIQNLALVDGQPQVLGLKRLLEVFLEHRSETVRRRTVHRRDKRAARLHLVEGLLKALIDIDKVIRLIRESDDAAAAKDGLKARFALSEIQAQYILDTPLRRLTKFDKLDLETEQNRLSGEIAELDAILADDKVLRSVVSKELAAVARDHGTERRTTLVDGDLKEVLAASVPAGPLEVADDPCTVLLSATGLLARTPVASEEAEAGRRRNGRAKHDAVLGSAAATARGQVLLVTSKGRAFKTNVLDLPSLPSAPGTVSVRGGVAATEVVPLAAGERVVGVAPMGEPADGGLGVAMGTRAGVVKVAAPNWPLRSDEFEIIGLKDGDEVLSATWVGAATDVFVFVTSDASLLVFGADKVRPQGSTSAAGMAGIKLAADAEVLSFSAVPAGRLDAALVVTSTGAATKVTPLAAYPQKGRATGGVRCQKFLKGDSRLVTAWVGPDAVGSTRSGDPVELPGADVRRDGSGVPVAAPDVVGSLTSRDA